MEGVVRHAHRPETPDGGSSDAVWGVTGVMDRDILPDEPAERRRRSRLYALRAMDRLGLLDEEALIPTLAGTPALRWLADEAGARWGVLIELGRIREPRVFEAAVEWALETRPRTEQAKTEIRRFRFGAIRSAVPSDPYPRKATGKEEWRRC